MNLLSKAWATARAVGGVFAPAGQDRWHLTNAESTTLYNFREAAKPRSREAAKPIPEVRRLDSPRRSDHPAASAAPLAEISVPSAPPPTRPSIGCRYRTAKASTRSARPPPGSRARALACLLCSGDF